MIISGLVQIWLKCKHIGSAVLTEINAVQKTGLGRGPFQRHPDVPMKYWSHGPICKPQKEKDFVKQNNNNKWAVFSFPGFYLRVIFFVLGFFCSF